MKREQDPAAGTLPPAVLNQLVTHTTGKGEPLGDAQVGQTMITMVHVNSGEQGDRQALFADELKRIIHDLKKRLPATLRLTVHNLYTAHRFALTRVEGAGNESRKDFSKRLDELLKGGGVYDLVVRDGTDGIPWALDAEGKAGRIRTLWLMLGARSSTEEIYDRTQRLLAEGGWQVHLLSDGLDTGLAWVTGVVATSGVVVSARNPTTLSEPIRELAGLVQRSRGLRGLRTGPRKRPAHHAFATLDRARARKEAVSPQAIADLQAMSTSEIALGRVGNTPIRVSLPTGQLAAHNGKMPLRNTPTVVTWADLKQLPEDATYVDRLRADGLPAIWLLVDSASQAAVPFNDGFWRGANRAIEPTPSLVARSLMLDHDVIVLDSGQP